jgi:hypothetical protein
VIADFQCGNKECGKVEEHYFPTSSHMPKTMKCSVCGSQMHKIWGAPVISKGGEVSGYEKENQGKMTLGKAIDMRQRWV